MPVEVPQRCLGGTLEEPERSLGGLMGVLGGALEEPWKYLKDALEMPYR